MGSSKSPQIRREFLGWDRPALPEAARQLATCYRQAATLDLGRVIVVVPGHRAGRRLQELFAFLAEDEELLLTPPLVVTEGELPEKLYTPKQPFASDVVQDLAWAKALRDLPAKTRQHVVPHPPGDADALRWLQLGKVLRGLHRELAADGLDYAAVLQRGPKLADFNESARWQALTELQQRYHDLLDAQKLWDRQTARLKAVEFREIETDKDIILLGTVDLNDSLRQMLDQIADRVTAYIVAPAELADRFDSHGCLKASAWSDAPIPLRDEQLLQVEGPAEQAETVSRWLAEIGTRYRSDAVVIGVPDESLVPQLQRELEQCGVTARWVEGVRLGETASYRLLAAAVEFASRRRYEDLAALVRHPDLEDWLQSWARTPNLFDQIGENRSAIPQARSLPAQLDRFYNEHLPSHIRLGPTLQKPDWPDLAAAVERIEHWLAPAATDHPLRDWGEVFRKILGDVYGGRTLELDKSADDALHRIIKKILAVCDRLVEVPAALDTASLPAVDAFQVALKPLADEFLPPPPAADAVEILGWLELPLDDAPALLVTSFNEGFVPKSAGADAFLPDRLRRELNLLHNDRRYARDAYAASVLCQSRPELRVVFARRDTNKDPLHPSRLLFACSDETLVARAQRFFGKQRAPAAPRRLLLAPAGEIPNKSSFIVPLPIRPLEATAKIPVTHFKAYLACPYRYYLRHVRKLKAIDDSARELDGGVFGTLLHRVLGAFGRASTDLRDCERAQRIFEFLAEQLDLQAAQLYGQDQHRPALRLQLEQARHRLKAFAACQSELVQAGTNSDYVEKDERGDLEVPFRVNGTSITLVGRIDRIDFHEQQRTIRIVDYKTTDRGQSPEQTHRKGEEWIDLQLPLYRHLWRKAELDVPAEVKEELGYFNLPKQLEKTAFVAAAWDDAVLRNADEKARLVIRKLRGDDPYWPPVYDPVPDYSEYLAAICLDNTFGRPALGADDEGGAE